LPDLDDGIIEILLDRHRGQSYEVRLLKGKVPSVASGLSGPRGCRNIIRTEGAQPSYSNRSPVTSTDERDAAPLPIAQVGEVLLEDCFAPDVLLDTRRFK